MKKDMNDQLEANKFVVREFYNLAFNLRKPEEAVARYTGPYYRQHNPAVGWCGTFHRVCSRICKSLSVHAVRFQETGGGKRTCGDAQPSFQATAANENTMF